MKNRPFSARLGFAFAGLVAAWHRERSFRTHCIVVIAALVVLLILRPAPVWWAAVAIGAAFVVAMELVNSAVEALVDLLHPAIHPEVKALKDMLAGAVLVASVCSLCVAAALIIDRMPTIVMALGINR